MNTAEVQSDFFESVSAYFDQAAGCRVVYV